MLRRFCPVLVIACLGVSLSAQGQAPAKKKAGPTVQELQGQIIELQSQLMECQKAPKSPPPPDAYAEAMDGFRAFKSALDTGLNQSAYRDALIPLKVKVDKLEDSEKNKPLKDTLAVLVDAGHIWNASITQVSRGFAPLSSVYDYTGKYPSEWNAADAAFASQMRGQMRCYFQFGSSPQEYHGDCLRMFSENVLARARRELDSLLSASRGG